VCVLLLAGAGAIIGGVLSREKQVNKIDKKKKGGRGEGGEGGEELARDMQSAAPLPLLHFTVLLYYANLHFLASHVAAIEQN